MEYRRRCMPFNCAPGDTPILPTYQQSPVAENSNSLRHHLDSGGHGRRTDGQQTQQSSNIDLSGSRQSQQATIMSTTPDDSYLHWCVDINKVNTKLYHIPIHQVQRINDVRFIKRLKLAYNSDCGWRRWFSLTACYDVRFVMVRTVFGLRSAKDR